MNPRQRKQAEQALNALPRRERDRIFDEARRRRSDAQKRRRAKARETVDGERVGGRSRPDPLIDWALRIFVAEQTAKQAGSDQDDAARALIEGVVVGLSRRWAEVLPSEGDRAPVGCRLSAELAGRQQSGIAVGDRTVFSTDTDGDPEIVRVLERRTVLSRPDPRDPRTERVVAANIDAVVIVVSVVSPPLHPRLIDRYLVAVEHGGAEPIIAVNKADLLSTELLAEALSRIAPYRDAGIPVIVCRANPETGERDVKALRAALAGRTCAFVGHSGVGKSSLANALSPELGIETGEVRGQDLRGRHTTTSSRMHLIEDMAGEIRVIDTPGVRYFGLADVSPGELRWSFPEFVDHAASCRFADCTHDHEPGCAVKAAVESDVIPPVRYETYIRLLEELRTGQTPGEITERIRPLPEDE
ncbi:MAG: ribosome small subunit-dependent GTPase A [Planctomycetota bacterium]